MIRQTILIRCAGILALLAPPAPLHAQSARDSVVASVQEFFRSMQENDPAAAQRILLVDGISYSVRSAGDSSVVRRGTFESHLARLQAARDTVVERMWSPEVRVHGAIAMVWTPYDLYVNGRFSHCGVDAFSVVRTRAGWKIATVTYTVEPTGCAPSPLGPLPRR